MLGNYFKYIIFFVLFSKGNEKYKHYLKKKLALYNFFDYCPFC